MENSEIIKYESGLIQRVGNAISVTNKLLALNEPQLIPYRKKDKWGFCTVDKKIVIECVYDFTFFFNNELAFVLSEKQLLIINKKNEIIVKDINLLKIPSNVYRVPWDKESNIALITEWHKDIGEIVKPGLPIVEIEMEKAIFDLDSEYYGTLLYIRDAKGNQVRQDGILGIIGNPKTNSPNEDIQSVCNDIIDYMNGLHVSKNKFRLTSVNRKYGYADENGIEYWED